MSLAHHRYAAFLWLCFALFAVRVAAQALQRWLPQRFLPPFEQFQGSDLPYWLLLPTQLVICALMVRYCWKVHAGSLVPSRRTGVVLTWCGGIYMAGSAVRIAVGLASVTAPAWFSAWISGLLHIVLAAYLLTLAAYHLQSSQTGT